MAVTTLAELHANIEAMIKEKDESIIALQKENTELKGKVSSLEATIKVTEEQVKRNRKVIASIHEATDKYLNPNREVKLN